eukprot:TRINITY_DN1279_c0_g3_i1.p1 TRINITY_DN1279_c0_g3~~TRINITY_DN1279_c0_g3_i1.p1  ORF type:complete len:253 (+),score=39.78 TRINITY_DN1279_c0_g3_i1:201-959(+)
MACLISETIQAPLECPTLEIAQLLESSLLYHNSSDFRKSLDTYEKAHTLWLNETGHIPPSVEVFFLLITGQVLQSEGYDSLAITRYLLARQIVDRAPLENHENMAFVFSCLGNVYHHLGDRERSLAYFKKALNIREHTVGCDHVDTGLLYNNIAVCMIKYGVVVEEGKSDSDHEKVFDLFSKAYEIFLSNLGPSHPRSTIVYTNIEKEKQKGLIKNSQRVLNPLPWILIPAKIEKEKSKTKPKSKQKKITKT